MGQRVNTQTINLCVGIKQFDDALFNYRNSSNEINMLNYTVEFLNAFGTVDQKYIVREQLPDHDLGIIVLILGNYV
jgi:hypothetical protein